MTTSTRLLKRRSFIGGAAAFMALAVCDVSPAFADELADKQERANAVREEISQKQTSLAEASDAYYRALEEHDAAIRAVDDAKARIDVANTRIAALQQQLSQRARSMYRNGQITFIDCLLGSASFEEFTTTWDLMDSINESDASAIAQTKELRAEVEQEKAVCEEQERIAAEAQDEAAAVKAQAEQTIIELQALLDGLDKEVISLVEAEQANSSYQVPEGTPAIVYRGEDLDLPANDRVVDYALSKLGCPYIWAAEGPTTFDCSGLTKWCYEQVGITLPHYTESQYAIADAVLPLSQALPGDVLYRKGHVGIAELEHAARYIHAPTFNATVRNTDTLSWSGFMAALRFRGTAQSSTELARRQQA